MCAYVCVLRVRLARCSLLMPVPLAPLPHPSPAAAVARARAVCGRRTPLPPHPARSLGYNSIGDAGATALAQALPASQVTVLK